MWVFFRIEAMRKLGFKFFTPIYSPNFLKSINSCYYKTLLLKAAQSRPTTWKQTISVDLIATRRNMSFDVRASLFRKQSSSGEVGLIDVLSK